MNEEDSYSIIYSNIRRLCKERKVRMYQAERYAGVSPGYFSRMKNGKSISFFHIQKVAEYFGLKIDDLLTEPPPVTNADVFKTVFGADHRSIILSEAWWKSEYTEPETEVKKK